MLVFSIFTFIEANYLKFCTRSYSSCIYCMMRFKDSNGKVCKMMMSHFIELYLQVSSRSTSHLHIMSLMNIYIKYSLSNLS